MIFPWYGVKKVVEAIKNEASTKGCLLAGVHAVISPDNGSVDQLSKYFSGVTCVLQNSGAMTRA